MFLRRKNAFRNTQVELTTKSQLVCYLNRDPDSDYKELATMHTTQQNTTWVGEHRKHNSRQLAVIQPVANEEFTDFKFLAGLAHPNIARLRALYHKDSVVHVVYEYVELDVFDICPLSEAEIAEAMSQIISAVRKLFAMSISFAVACIRVTSSGTIKIVLDWTYESVREPSIQEALRNHIAIWLHETMQSLGCGRQHWTSDALAVFEQLSAGHLPMITDPFFANVRPLREATQYAIRKRLAIS